MASTKKASLAGIALNKQLRSAYKRAGTGSLIGDALQSTGAHAAAAVGKTKNVVLRTAGSKVPKQTYSRLHKKAKETIGDASYKYYGKPITKVDEALGNVAAKVPGLKGAVKTNTKFPEAITPQMKMKIDSGISLDKMEKHRFSLASKGHTTNKITAPVAKASKFVVPVAASMYLSDMASKNVGDNMTKKAETKDLLLKVAAHIRTLEQDKCQALDEAMELRKLAEAQNTVLEHLKEGLIDLDDITEKVAELVSNPDHGNSFFDEPNIGDFGQLTKTAQASTSNILEDFLLTGEYNHGT